MSSNAIKCKRIILNALEQIICLPITKLFLNIFMTEIENIVVANNLSYMVSSQNIKIKNINSKSNFTSNHYKSYVRYPQKWYDVTFASPFDPVWVSCIWG